ncbi:hypothetical protein BDA99DRAFT_520891 [Phascolomyces articulosus]|uniref:Uncharacterized protein n=1 Tax=Phascolomyces articulosus TaxID=60185 RepID=A0AAD5PBV6_9FUNG|nr:hypothetical protein BDA99DRAFT_520891 [Phascolomyces articulosus]
MPLIQSTQKILLLLALLCLSLNFLVQAQQNTITPEPRTDQGCVLLTHSPAIYCYGGQVFNPLYATDDKGVSSNSVFIKLNLTRDINVNQMQSSWEQIPSSIGSNYYFAMTAIPDTNSIFMDGGSGGGNGGINLVGRNTTIYNVEAQNPSWSTNIPTRENALVYVMSE